MSAPSSVDLHAEQVAVVASPDELVEALRFGPPHIIVQDHLDLTAEHLTAGTAATFSVNRAASIRVRSEPRPHDADRQSG